MLVSPLSWQPSFYLECTKANMRLFYDVRLVSNAKYTRPTILNSLLIPLLIATRVLGLIRCYEARQ